MQNFKLQVRTSLPITEQIVQSVMLDIEKGYLEKNEQLLSINLFSKQHKIARDTVEKAYVRLKANGYITSVKGKGYYSLGKHNKKIKVLFIFNKLSSYKRIIYDAFVKTLGDAAVIDIFIHHYSPDLLQENLENNVGKYSYYVIMPHFLDHLKEADYLKVLHIIPNDQLILLDKNIPQLSGLKGAVYQDFEHDIYDTLNSAISLLKKYQSINLIFPQHENHPIDICYGIKRFCVEKKMEYFITRHLNDELINNQVYIVLTESDLAILIKKIRRSDLIIGKDIGVISFNETVFKELLDITVITTDFEKMGKSAAEIILDNKTVSIRNPFKLIKRKSI